MPCALKYRAAASAMIKSLVCLPVGARAFSDFCAFSPSRVGLVLHRQVPVWCGIKKLTKAYSQGFHNKTKENKYSKWHVKYDFMNTKYRQ